MIEPSPQSLLKKSYGSRWALFAGINHWSDASISGGYESGRTHSIRSPDKPNPPSTRAEILPVPTGVVLAAGENGLIPLYSCGHGVDLKGLPYLHPLADTAVELNLVKQINQESAARAGVLTLDACCAGTEATRHRVVFVIEDLKQIKMRLGEYGE